MAGQGISKFAMPNKMKLRQLEHSDVCIVRSTSCLGCDCKGHTMPETIEDLTVNEFKNLKNTRMKDKIAFIYCLEQLTSQDLKKLQMQQTQSKHVKFQKTCSEVQVKGRGKFYF